MTSRYLLAAAIGASALIGAAHATDMRAVDTYLSSIGSKPAGDVLCPTDVRMVALGSASAAVYYTFDPDGADVVRVVTTIASDPAGVPARFVSYLAAGEKAEVSVAGPVGTEPASLQVAYDGDLVTVRPIVQVQPQG